MQDRPVDALLDLAARVQAQIAGMYEREGVPEPDSELDQVGLRDGQSIVMDYVRHGEEGLAAEHLLYMVSETEVRLSVADYGLLQRILEHYRVSTPDLLPHAVDDASLDTGADGASRSSSVP